MGADGLEYIDFEKELTKNIRSISRRVLEGNYFFYPLLETHRPKPKGGFRILSVCSIRDALVQRQIYEIIYPVLENKFANPTVNYISFAYRKGFSAPRAIVNIHRHVKTGYIHAIDADLSKFFDTIDHDILYQKLAFVLGDSPLILKLLKRFIKSDRVPQNTYSKRSKNKKSGRKVFKVIRPIRVKRKEGIPQGGILSGLLANLFLADFDRWVATNLKSIYDIQYARYADDFVILSKDNINNDTIRQLIADEMTKIKLKLNLDKTKFIDIDTSGLDFLGFIIDSKSIRISSTNIQKYKERIEMILNNFKIEKYTHLDNNTLCKIVCNRLSYKVTGISEKQCEKCGGTLEGPPRSWVAFFSTITSVDDLRYLDKWTRMKIYSFLWRTSKMKVHRKHLNGYYKSLEKEYYRIKKLKRCSCSPELITDKSLMGEVDLDTLII